jgi:hypothetical protein
MPHVLSVGIREHAPDAGQYTCREFHSIAGAGRPSVDGQSHLTVGLLAADVVWALLIGLSTIYSFAVITQIDSRQWLQVRT